MSLADPASDLERGRTGIKATNHTPVSVPKRKKLDDQSATSTPTEVPVVQVVKALANHADHESQAG